MKDPAVLFYTQDFLVGTMDMSFEDKGKYITLLCYQHQKGHFSKETIRLLVGLVSVSVLEKFEEDEQGLFFHPRMDFEIEKRRCFIESRRENGILGGRPKKPNGKAYDKTNAKPNGKPTENLPENENIFYSNEISNNIDSSYIENYKQFIEFIFGKNELKQPMTCWLKLRDQLTFEQFIKIYDKAKEKKRKIRDLIFAGYNRPKKYLKGNVSFYATLNSWLNRND
jgi:hypothetical protein